MSDKERKCYSYCAFADKTGDTMWCKFHDLSVSSNIICDYFFDQADNPQTIGLYKELAANGAEDPRSRRTGLDIFTNIMTLFF